MKREAQINQAAIEDVNVHANCRGLYSFIAGAEWADNHPLLRWISIEDKVPNDHKVVVIADIRNGFVGLGIYIDKQWYYNSGCMITPVNFITHWMPIPKIKEE